jgi:hypothetical protein
MEMTEFIQLVRYLDFLDTEAQSLVDGKVHQIAADEWLYLYSQIKAHLVGRQAVMFCGFEGLIRGIDSKRNEDSIAA